MLEALKRSRWNLEAAEMARADVDFFLEFVVGLEEILKGPQLTGIKLIDDGDNFRMIETDPAEDFSDMGEVFLFNVGIVVFFVRP